MQQRNGRMFRSKTNVAIDLHRLRPMNIESTVSVWDVRHKWTMKQSVHLFRWNAFGQRYSCFALLRARVVVSCVFNSFFSWRFSRSSFLPHISSPLNVTFTQILSAPAALYFYYLQLSPPVFYKKNFYCEHLNLHTYSAYSHHHNSANPRMNKIKTFVDNGHWTESFCCKLQLNSKNRNK